MDSSNVIAKALLFLVLSLHQALTVSHSLQYFYTAVTSGINFPEFTAVGLVDGQQFVYYDSNIRQSIPKTEWIKKVDDDDPDYWNRETQIQQDSQETLKVDVATGMERFNQTKGVHTVQWRYGCELDDDDGTKRGYEQYGYDGEDFVSLDLNTLTWTAANDKAKITKHKWDSHIGNSVSIKDYLQNTCIEWLQKYVSYGRDTLERKDPPVVNLFQKDSSSTVVCHATGFFPRGVMISWQKNGEELYENVELTETLPNQDGTFQKRSILTVSPEELHKNDYTCVVHHSGREKVLRVADRRVLNTGGVLVVVIAGVMATLLVLIGCIGFFIWKKNEKPFASDGESSTRSSESLQSSNGLNCGPRTFSTSSDGTSSTSSNESISSNAPLISK
ncbi:H-2 class I histocompatibility antigen, Q7 alpha chain-like [Electrophorus electricus]|uniref:Ig-like domain-containing protein n=1 Tax=Electrophorus electricus TaxID=8005 RepID=A0A4W4E2P2_ELEEL|nr:H-2 class I histocompatibility antigen, Q7 alpha chain-like [Electrophorus electricus]